MTRYFVASLMIVLAALACPAPSWAQNDGLEDLDQATQLQMTAKSLNDLGGVIKLLESALEKGLDESNEVFAKQLLSSALYQRAENLVEAIPKATSGRQAVQLLATALNDLKKAIEYQPTLGSAHFLMAKLQWSRGERDEARTAIEQAIGALDDDKEQRSKALVLRAEMTEDEDKKLADYDEAIKLDPGNADAWQRRAMFHLDRGDSELAAKQFEKLLEQDSKNVVALHGASEALMQMERYEEALQYIDRAIELAPSASIGYISKARLLAVMERVEDAIKELDKAAKQEPSNPTILLMRARLHEADDNRKAALADIEALLARRPNYPEAILLRSMLAASDGRFSAAIADIQILIREDPENIEWQLQLAAYYNADKRPRRAIDVYGEVLEQEPEDWQAMRGRADALLSVGEHAKAIADYEKAVKIRPDDSGILNNLAWVLATSPTDELRDGKRAIGLATKACEETDYEAAHILSTLAACYAEAGDFEKAVKWSSKAVELGEEELKDQLSQELESYKEGKPWRELQTVDGPSLP